MLHEAENEMFSFEVDSENALVGCTLERGRLPVFSVHIQYSVGAIVSLR